MLKKIIYGFCIFIVVFFIIFNQILKPDCLVGKWTDCSKNQRKRIITPDVYGGTCSLDTTQYCSDCVIGPWTDCLNNQKTRIIISAINGGTCSEVDTTQACNNCIISDWTACTVSEGDSTKRIRTRKRTQAMNDGIACTSEQNELPLTQICNNCIISDWTACTY